MCWFIARHSKQFPVLRRFLRDCFRMNGKTATLNLGVCELFQHGSLHWDLGQLACPPWNVRVGPQDGSRRTRIWRIAGGRESVVRSQRDPWSSGAPEGSWLGRIRGRTRTSGLLQVWCLMHDCLLWCWCEGVVEWKQASTVVLRDLVHSHI